MATTLFIDEELRVSEGTVRWVYRHPNDPKKLLKVYKKPFFPPGESDSISLLDKIKHSLSRRRQLREVKEHLRVLCNPCDPLIYHLPDIHGYVKTNRGIAQVVDHLTDASGNTAPTLRQLMEIGHLTDKHHQQLNHLFQRLIASQVIASDIVIDNIVYASTPEGNRFFVIDGLGDHTPLGTYRWRPAANLRKKQRMISKIQLATPLATPPE